MNFPNLFISQKVDKLKEEIDLINENDNRTKELKNRIKELKEKISSDISFKNKSDNIIYGLKNECADLEIEKEELKGKIVELAFKEISQSLSLSREPFSTSLENVDMATPKIARGRFLGYWLSERVSLQKSINDLERLRSSVFCLPSIENQYMYALNDTDEDKASMESFLAESISKESEKFGKTSSNIKAENEINEIINQEMSKSYMSGDIDEIQFNSSHFSARGGETKPNEMNEKLMNEINLDSSIADEANEISMKIDEISDMKQKSIDLSPELLEKIENLSRIGPFRALKYFCETSKCVSKANDAISKLYSVLTKGEAIPSDISKTAEEIRKKSEEIIKIVSRSARKADAPLQIKSALPIDFPEEKTFDAVEIDQQQLEMTNREIEDLKCAVDKHVNEQKELIGSLKCISYSNENDNDNDILFEDEEQRMIIEQIMQLTKEIKESQDQQIDILTNHLESMPDDVFSSIADDEFENTVGEKTSCDVDVEFNKLKKKDVYKMRGVEEIDIKSALANSAMPEYNPGIKTVQAFICPPSDENISSVYRHIDEFNDSIADEDNPVMIVKERKEYLQSEYEKQKVKLIENLETGIKKTQDFISKKKSQLEKIEKFSDEMEEKGTKMQERINEIKEKIHLNELILATKNEINSVNENVRKEKNEIKASSKRHKNKK